MIAKTSFSTFCLILVFLVYNWILKSFYLFVTCFITVFFSFPCKNYRLIYSNLILKFLRQLSSVPTCQHAHQKFLITITRPLNFKFVILATRFNSFIKVVRAFTFVANTLFLLLFLHWN